MPKHKKDKHAKSILKGKDHQQTGVPPVEGEASANIRGQKAFQYHDPENRLGSFEGTGDHARTGNRGHQ